MTPSRRTGTRLAVRAVRAFAMGAALGFAVPSIAPRAGAASPAPEAPVWPAPPEPGRVRWVGELRSARDLGRSESLLGRFARGLVGAKSKHDLALVRPSDVYAEDSTRLFVSDGSSSRLLAFDARSRRVTVLGRTGPGRLTKPLGLGGDGRGHLLVADPSARRVVAFTLAGEYVASYGGRGVLLNPVDATGDPVTGRVYVVDSYLHQVVVFDRSGVVVRRIGRTDEGPAVRDSEFAAAPDDSVHGALQRGSHDARGNRGGGPGEFLYPVSLTLVGDSLLCVSDGINGRVQVFDRDGGFRFQFGGLGDGPGRFARPKGIAHDPEGHLYVVDAAFNNVQVFDRHGALLLALGELGGDAGRFRLPLGIHVDRDGRIYVADRYNGRVQVLRYVHTAEAVD